MIIKFSWNIYYTGVRVDGTDPISRPVGRWHRECADGARFKFPEVKKNPGISPFFLRKTLRKCRINGSTPNWSLAATKTWFLVKKHKKERVDGSTAKRYLGSIKISTYERKTGKPNRWLNFPETISVWGSWPRAGAGVLKIEKCFGEYSICSRFVLVDLQ